MHSKVSVIVPVYNGGALLSRCLDSLTNQTLKNIEIICVNDGSTDNSREILERYATKDSRIKILHQENLGQGTARNVGMDAANGEYLGFVDADDWIELDYFEKLYRAARKHNVEIACCGIIRKYPSFRTKKKLTLAEERVYSLTLEKYQITETPRKCYVYNKIYKRSEIEKHQLRFPEGVFFEDIPFTIRALYYLKTLVTVPDTVYFYWVNHKSTTRDMGDKKQHDLLAARKDFIKFSRRHHINCEENHYIKKKITYKFLGMPLLKIYQWKTIEKYYLFALIPIFEKRISL
ncbi:MAG: glycosyltransferase [Holosporaceae bacterium]|jgi:glycosyltransferase involved in cell wall biosynthesis|nr:glycosyltransferase [Holosporaceae bacterium]